MSEAAVTSKGRVTITDGIRKSMSLKARDRVVFTRLTDGTVVMRAKVRSIADLAGSVPKRAKQVRIEDMRLGGRR